jgi:hypothetical protein
MSPFLTFLLYCLFVGFVVYYLTKDKLDEKSRYILIGVLILPYVFMDQYANFSNVDSNITQTIPRITTNETYSNVKQVVEQPKIVLKENEKVENVKVVEELKNIQTKQNNKQVEKSSSSNKEFTLEEVQKLLNAVKKESSKTKENFGSMYNGTPPEKYDDDQKFTDQSLVPLGQNGNGLTNEWDHDYILLNTDKWAPALKPAPVCKTEQKCPVCPNLTTGYPLMLRDFDSSRRVTAPIKADIPSMNATESVPSVMFPNADTVTDVNTPSE